MDEKPISSTSLIRLCEVEESESIEGGLTSTMISLIFRRGGSHFLKPKKLPKIGGQNRRFVKFGKMTWKLMMVTNHAEIGWMIGWDSIHSHNKNTHKDFDLYPIYSLSSKKQEPKFMLIYFPIDIQSHLLRIRRCFRYGVLQGFKDRPRVPSVSVDSWISIGFSHDGSAIIPTDLTFSYCWWFRNPANSPVEVGLLYHYLQRLFLHPRWFSTLDFWTINSTPATPPGGFLVNQPRIRNSALKRRARCSRASAVRLEIGGIFCGC